MAELTIRRYRPDDGARVRELHELAMRDVGAYVDAVPDDDLGNVTETYLEAGGEFLVGEVDGRIVAMGRFDRSTRRTPSRASSAISRSRRSN